MSHYSHAYTVQPTHTIKGSIQVPGDKSISHRAIILGSLAAGVTEVKNFLHGEDNLATLQAFREMGVKIEQTQDNVMIHGVGLHGLHEAKADLYCGNSGTSMRLLAGILSGQNFNSVLTGDDSLSRRPMERVCKPLRLMGAHIETASGKGAPPLHIKGGQLLKGIAYEMPVASAQVKSSVLLAGLYAQGETSVIEPAPTRDHTERMLQGFGYAVERVQNKITLQGGAHLKAAAITVPGDISSAAFFIVAAAITPHSQLRLENVGINPTRIGIINILRAMGAQIQLVRERWAGAEPVADIDIQYRPLQGIEIPLDQVPLAIDEFPIIFIAAASASGKTILRGAEELRVKETDRIQVMAEGLQALGVKAEPTADGMVIEGGQLQAGTIDSRGDHRIAMAFAIGGIGAKGPIVIKDCANVATSFPNFVELAAQVGLHIVIN